MTAWLTPALLCGMLFAFAGAYAFLRQRYPTDSQTLIDTVDALLPQTQCAQCNYPGCRPYAEAIVNQAEALNLCPPGGAELHEQLVALMGAERAGAPPQALPSVVAVIDESECIGCALCLPPCPVDAIVGAPNKMHTVLTQDCTGCELCVPACPVDCISLEPVAAPVQQRRRKRRPRRAPDTIEATPRASRACINCARCNPVCPVNLPAQALLQGVRQGRSQQAIDLGLMDCIECGLCDQVCPSDIPMAEIFGNAKWRQQRDLDDEATRRRFKARYEAHNERLAAAEAAATQRRQERLQRHRDASRWQ